MTESQRLDRLESKVDKIQDQMHSNHLELLNCFNRSKDETDADIGAINLKLKEHDGHFSMVARLLGLGSILGGWISIKDWFSK